MLVKSGRNLDGGLSYMFEHGKVEWNDCFHINTAVTWEIIWKRPADTKLISEADIRITTVSYRVSFAINEFVRALYMNFVCDLVGF